MTPEELREHARDGLHRAVRLEHLKVNGAIPDDEVRAAVDDSYALVVAKLPRKHRPDGWDRV